MQMKLVNSHNYLYNTVINIISVCYLVTCAYLRININAASIHNKQHLTSGIPRSHGICPMFQNNSSYYETFINQYYFNTLLYERHLCGNYFPVIYKL